jgi:hypothetical protein
MRNLLKKEGSVYLDLTGAALEMDIPDASEVFQQQNHWECSTSIQHLKEGKSMDLHFTRISNSSSKPASSDVSLMDAIDYVSSENLDDDDDDDDEDTMACDYDNNTTASVCGAERNVAPLDDTRQQLLVEPLKQPLTKAIAASNRVESWKNTTSHEVARDNSHPSFHSNGLDSRPDTRIEGNTVLGQHSSHSRSSRPRLSRGSRPAESLERLKEQERNSNFDDAILRLRSSSSRSLQVSSGSHRPLHSISDSSHHSHSHARASSSEDLVAIGSRGGRQRWSHSTPTSNARLATATATMVGQEGPHHGRHIGARQQSMYGRFSTNSGTVSQRSTMPRNDTSHENSIPTRSTHSEPAYRHNDSNGLFNQHSRTLSGYHGRSQDPRAGARFAPSEHQQLQHHPVPIHAVPTTSNVQRPSTVFRQQSEPIRDVSYSERYMRQHPLQDRAMQARAVPSQVLEHEHWTQHSRDITTSMQPQFNPASGIVTPPEIWEERKMGDCGTGDSTSVAPADTPVLEVFPGDYVPYLGVEHVLEVMATGDYDVTTCVACQEQLNCSNEGHYILCPQCDTISPIFTTKKRPPPPQKCVVLGFKLKVASHR